LLQGCLNRQVGLARAQGRQCCRRSIGCSLG
jgi:hypothetical protein